MNHKRVKMRDHKKEVNLFKNRVTVAFCGILLFTLVLVGNLYRLQVENFKSYQTRANGNRIKVLPIPPTRGLIYDRNGVLLAENELVFNLTMIPEQTDDVDAML
ncbi:penicillin-binding protein 2, partial [Vibrio splendidus]